MAWSLDELQTEVYARGLNYLNDVTGAGVGVARVKRWINDAVHTIDELGDWPYLNTTTSGTTPLTIADLRTVETVTDVAGLRVISPFDRRTLRSYAVNLTTAGAPWGYYITGGTTVNVFPTSASLSITVDYWRFSPDLVGPTDEPLMPDRYRYAIVEYAVARGLRDEDDESGAQAAQAAGDLIVQRMIQTLMTPQHQATQDFVAGYGEDQ